MRPALAVTDFISFMDLALEEAREAARLGEVPVGAVIIDTEQRKVLARAFNLTERSCDPTAHAEMLVIQEACRILKAPRLPHCDLYVTLEPCPMCAQAISFARIRRLYFGAWDEKGGGVESGPRIFSQPTCHHTPDIYGGIRATEAGDLLKNFFQERRI